MPRILTLVRHAKSSWDQAGIQDFDRPLNQRGLKNAPQMGQRLADKCFRIDCIISSPAVRAISTAEIIAHKIGFETENITQNADIYEASLNSLVSIVHSLEDNLARVMLVGHNPGFTGLANYLSNANIDNLPTCSIMQIQFARSWRDISEHTGELIDLDYPKK